jgi:hypothetical protein
VPTRTSDTSFAGLYTIEILFRNIDMKSEEDFEQVFLSARATVAPKPDRAGIFESKPSTPLVPENGTTGATSGGAGSWRPELIGAPDLCDRKFHELRYIVHGIIPEGVTLLVPPSGSRDSGLREGTQANVEDQDRAVHHLFQRHHGQALPLDLRREASRRIA